MSNTVKGWSLLAMMSAVVVYITGVGIVRGFGWASDVDDFMKAGDRMTRSMATDEHSAIVEAVDKRLQELAQEWAEELKATMAEHRSDMRKFDDRIDIIEQDEREVIVTLRIMRDQWAEDLARLEATIEQSL